MCGIAGVLRLEGGVPDAAGVRAMAAALAHRGPDGEGFFEDGPLCLGHRRLAILDLSPAAAQPMADASGRWVVVYNGEIYNYLELRAEMEAAGVRFRSRSDTEVLLELYARQGPAGVERFNGMFAFAIWDRAERTLFAARDRFGEKPFFYRWTPGREFRFASEAKALLLPGDPPARPHEEVLLRFLGESQRWQQEESHYEGVLHLPPAHWLRVRDGRLTVQRYWSLPGRPEPPEGSEADRVWRLAELLEESVRIRMRSDVPLGTCLSGGLDSSTVVALVARILERSPPGSGVARRATFSASFPDSPTDETRYVDAMAAATGVEPHRVDPTSEGMLEELPRLMHHQDEPFSDPSIYAEWKVMELASKNGVTVLLNGQGGDEVFAGYHLYFGDFWWSLLARGRWLRLRREMRDHDAVHGRGSASRLLESTVRGRVPRWLRRLKPGGGVLWLTEDFRRRAEGEVPPRPADLRQSLRDSQGTRMLNHLLRQADRSSMAFSREARLPLLDHRLVEFVDGLPDSMKLRGGTTKWALREAIRGLVPESIRLRSDKVGFGVHGAGWLRGGMAEAVRDTLLSRDCLERGIFEPRWLQFNLDRLGRGDDTASGPLWSAFLAETWLRVCIDGRNGSR